MQSVISQTSRPVSVTPVVRIPSTRKSIGVVGSRQLSYKYADKVGFVVEDLLKRGYSVATGGAMGVDQFVIDRLIRIGKSDKSTVYAPWRGYTGFPKSIRAMMCQYKAYGGTVAWGQGQPGSPSYLIKKCLLHRNDRLVSACHGVVAFIDATSRGTIYTIKKAVSQHRVVVVFAFDCELPDISGVKWAPLRCSGPWESGYKAVAMS